MPEAAESTELRILQSTSAVESNSAINAINDPELILPTTAIKPEMRQSQVIIVIMQLTAITFLTSITTGLITVSIPHIAAELSIQPQLYYW